ncbi:MAG TPA: hypothetical protein VHN12_15990 [Geobacteraceae bacterium]|nr:hypothetical protein [Geobacteraceae bacterium]
MFKKIVFFVQLHYFNILCITSAAFKLPDIWQKPRRTMLSIG